MPQIMCPWIMDHPGPPHPEMDKSKKEEAKLEAEETFWEGPPSSTEAFQTRIRIRFNHVGVVWCVFCYFLLFPVVCSLFFRSHSLKTMSLVEFKTTTRSLASLLWDQILKCQMFAPFLSCFVVIGSQPWKTQVDLRWEVVGNDSFFGYWVIFSFAGSF